MDFIFETNENNNNSSIHTTINTTIISTSRRGSGTPLNSGLSFVNSGLSFVNMRDSLIYNRTASSSNGSMGSITSPHTTSTRDIPERLYTNPIAISSRFSAVVAATAAAAVASHVASGTKLGPNANTSYQSGFLQQRHSFSSASTATTTTATIAAATTSNNSSSASTPSKYTNNNNVLNLLSFKPSEAISIQSSVGQGGAKFSSALSTSNSFVYATTSSSSAASSQPRSLEMHHPIPLRCSSPEYFIQFLEDEEFDLNAHVKKGGGLGSRASINNYNSRNGSISSSTPGNGNNNVAFNDFYNHSPVDSNNSSIYMPAPPSRQTASTSTYSTNTAISNSSILQSLTNNNQINGMILRIASPAAKNLQMYGSGGNLVEHQSTTLLAAAGNGIVSSSLSPNSSNRRNSTGSGAVREALFRKLNRRFLAAEAAAAATSTYDNSDNVSTSFTSSTHYNVEGVMKGNESDGFRDPLLHNAPPPPLSQSNDVTSNSHALGASRLNQYLNHHHQQQQQQQQQQEMMMQLEEESASENNDTFMMDDVLPTNHHHQLHAHQQQQYEQQLVLEDQPQHPYLSSFIHKKSNSISYAINDGYISRNSPS